MEEANAGDYDELKTAIFKRYDISEETYRQRLRALRRKSDESHREMAVRAMDLTSKWSRECKTVQEVLELVAMEQLLSSMSEDTRVRVRERKPKTCAEAGELADDIERARRSGKVDPGRQPERRPVSNPLKCFSCGQPGHRSPDCPKGRRPEERSNQRRPDGHGPPRDTQPTNRGDRYKEPCCYECGKLGHFATRCPSRALYGEGRPCYGPEAGPRQNGRVCRSGTVDGERVRDILLDTGCTRTLVHQRLIPEDKKTSGEVVVR